MRRRSENGTTPLLSVTSGSRYSTSSVSNPPSEAWRLADLPAMSSMRMRRKKISAIAHPGEQSEHGRRYLQNPIPALSPTPDADGDKQQNGDQGIARQIVDMSDPAALAAHARQFTIGMVEKIRQDQEQRREIRPAISSGQKRRGRRQARRSIEPWSDDWA